MSNEASGRGKTLRAAEMSKLGELTVSSQRDGDIHSICLHGELDLATAGGVDSELQRVEATDAKAIVLDLSQVKFMDSTGIRMLLNADARSRADSARLTLLRGPAAVQRVLAITGVEDRLPFAD